MSVLKNITSVYKSYSRYPSLNSAKLLSNSHQLVINSLWTINDLVSSKSKTVSISYHYDVNLKTIMKSSPVLLDEEVLMDVFSPCCKYRAIFLDRKNNESLAKDSKINLIHIWKDELLVKSINLTEMDNHGPVQKKSFNFGNFQWFNNGEKLIYIAESKKSKKLSYFQTAPVDSVNKDIEVGSQYKYKIDFGEQLGCVENPVICILDVNKEQVQVFTSLMLCPESTIGTFYCHPKGTGFLFTGYRKMPYELGLIYCTQRCCDLFYYDLESKKVTKIGDEIKSKMSPKFSPDGRYIIWLENDANGPHMQCQRLMRYEVDSGSIDIVVDIVTSPLDEFAGLYNLGLTENCWTTDSKHILITTQNKSQNKIILIDMETKNLRVLNNSEAINSETLLDFNGRFLLVKVSSPFIVPYLAIGEIQDALVGNEIRLISVSSVYNLESVLSCQILEHEPEFIHPKFGKKTYQSIFVASKKEGILPLILMLHGGPHSAFSTEFSIFCASVAELGFHVLMVNYRGSWGFGQDSINSLLGYIGQVDVDDCIKASEDVIKNFSSIVDGNNIFLYGGSHGGFLSAHLAAKYSNRVKAMACRNPVINILSMVTSTDIPDWTYVECGIPWSYNYLLNNENILSMWEKSPLKLVDEMKCPILIMIGQDDKRVPPSQGIELYKSLRARSIKTELYIYPKDSHPLASVEATSDGIVNVLLWFSEHITA